MSQAAAEVFDVGGVRLAQPFKAVRLGHFGLWHRDVRKVLGVYIDDLGFRHTDNVTDPTGKLLVGFTSCNTDHHVLVAMNPDTADPERRRFYDAGVTVNQISFQVNTLREINDAWDFFQSRGVRISRIGRDLPGSNWAVYAFDPDGHRIELFYGMEQIGWNGKSKPLAMYQHLPYEKLPLPQVAEAQEVQQARAQGIDLQSGFGAESELPYVHDVGGVLLQRPFKIGAMGPVRIFVADIDASEKFYTEIIGLVKTEEVIYQGHRCVFLRTGNEHHSLALIPKVLRGALGMSTETTLMTIGVQVQTYRQLVAAREFLRGRGMTELMLPAELHPGIEHAAHLSFDGIHCIQLYFQMDPIGWDGKPRPGIGARGATHWPETLEGDVASYVSQRRQGPMA